MTTDGEVRGNDTAEVVKSEGAGTGPGNEANADASQNSETIKLDQFLKLADLVGSGGEAKHLIRSGAVLVNGEEETRRGRKLRHGDVVTFNGEEYVIETSENAPS